MECGCVNYIKRHTVAICCNCDFSCQPALTPNDSGRSAYVGGVGASGAGAMAGSAQADLGCYQVCFEGAQLSLTLQMVHRWSTDGPHVSTRIWHI